MALQDLLPAPPDRRWATPVREGPAFYVADVASTTCVITSPLSTPTGARVIHVDLETLTGDIPVTLTWPTAPTAPVLARFNGGAWQTLIASPSGNGGSGTLTGVPAGQGAVEIMVLGSDRIAAISRCVTLAIVLFLYGQSNTVGSYADAQIYTGAGAWRPFKFAGSGEAIWADMEDPTYSNASGGKGSLWPLVATLLSDYLNVPVCIITAAVGGTGYVADAYPPEANGNKWRAAGTNTLNAIATLIASGVNGCIAIHIQGEREAGPNTPLGVLPDGYIEAFEETRAAISEAVWGDPDLMQVLVVQIGSQPTAGRTNLNLTRLAHRRMWDELPNVIPGFATCDITLDPTGGPDGGPELHHWTTNAHAETIAARIFHALKVGVFGATGGRGPQFSEAVVLDTTHVDVTFTLENEGTVTLGSVNTGVWRIIDGATRRTVSSCTATQLANEVTFHLTLSAGINQMPITLSYGDDDDASGCTILDAAGLPPEPLWDELVYDSDGPDEDDEPATVSWEELPEEETFVRAGPPASYVAVLENGEEEEEDATVAWEAAPGVETFVRASAATYVGSV